LLGEGEGKIFFGEGNGKIITQHGEWLSTIHMESQQSLSTCRGRGRDEKVVVATLFCTRWDV
jgi:hypothetical protein